MRGIRPFYSILIKQKKIPSTTTWADFQRVFANWPIWRKFTETRKPRHEIWQHYASFNIDAEYAIDVALMAKNYKKFVGILVAINVCTRLVSAEPIRKRSGEELTRALKTIIQRTGIKPQYLYTDKEPGLKSKTFKEYVGQEDIDVVYTNSLYKVGLVEREIKYLKQSLDKHLDKTKKKDWPKYLQSIIKKQNLTYNKAIGGVPAKITVENVWKYVKKKHPPLKDFEKWYFKDQKIQAKLNQGKPPQKLLKAKDGYLYVKQPVYINLASVQLLHDSRDPTVKRSKTG